MMIDLKMAHSDFKQFLECHSAPCEPSPDSLTIKPVVLAPLTNITHSLPLHHDHEPHSNVIDKLPHSSNSHTALPPIQRLPSEILSEIFLQSPTSWPYTCPVTEAIRFSQVCSLWRTVAIATPNLWNRIVIRCCTYEYRPSLGFIQFCLRRASNLPLYVYIGIMEAGTQKEKLDTLSNLVTKHIGRMKRLELFIPLSWLSYLPKFTTGSAPMLESFGFRINRCFGPEPNMPMENLTLFKTLPCLRNVDLVMTMVNLRPDSFAIPWSQLTCLSLTNTLCPPTPFRDVLRLCTDLVDCNLTLQTWTVVDASSIPVVPITTLPYLRSLELTFVNQGQSHPIFSRLILPRLKTLEINFQRAYKGSTEFDALRKLKLRSSMDLERFTMTSSTNKVEEVIDFLDDMRSLSFLKIGNCTLELPQLFKAMTYSGNNLLPLAPNLRALLLHVENHEPAFDTGLNALVTSRRSADRPVRRLEKIVVAIDDGMLGDELLEFLKRCQANGLELITNRLAETFFGIA